MKIRILYLIDHLFGFGGTERHIFQLATRLNPEKFKCIVAPMRFSEEIILFFRQAGINVLPVPVERIYGTSGLKQAFVLRGAYSQIGRSADSGYAK